MRWIQFVATGAVALTITLGSSASSYAQARTTAQQQYKGVLEPVSYPEDLDLTHVFFVTADVGWVAGKAGTILRTIDGGKKWEAQLGGDPADQSEAVRVLHFLDERRGWAIQGMKTLYTRDGESWEEIGSAPYGVDEMAFVSPRVGFVAGNPSAVHYGPTIMYRTTDGGRSWKPVWTCNAKVAMGGVTKSFGCEFGQMQFPSQRVGYVVAKATCAGMGCGPPPLLGKTTDGGETWEMMGGPGVVEQDFVNGIFFLDENTGYARLGSGKLHMTTDGGETWRGIVASPGEAIQFADPMVGWGVELGWSELRFSYTTDGGKRWSSRRVRLPETVRAYSMPRRDRAYIVGTGGMIFRYRVIPVSQPLVANAVEAPAMPSFDSAIDEQVDMLEDILEDLGEELQAASAPAQQGKAGGARGGSGGGGAGTATTDPFNTDSLAALDSAAVWNEPFEAPLPPASGFTANCCKKSFSRLEITLAALSQTLPEFVGKYKNLNLLLAAVRMGAELPDEYRSLKGDLRTFRRAQDKESATAALSGVIQALTALKQTTAIAMQKELPPVPTGTDEAFAPQGQSKSGQSRAASGSDAAEAKPGTKAKSGRDEVKDAAREAAKEAAKAGIGSIFKRKP
jgi:photosystem II stability/assembly factor-like uncharacterized protein